MVPHENYSPSSAVQQQREIPLPQTVGEFRQVMEDIATGALSQINATLRDDRAHQLGVSFAEGHLTQLTECDPTAMLPVYVKQNLNLVLLGFQLQQEHPIMKESAATTDEPRSGWNPLKHVAAML